MIRPIPVMPVHICTASLWATVAAHFIVFGIFLLAVWILCKKAVKENERINHLPFCLSIAVGLVLLLLYGVTITTVKGMILALLLLYASLSDLKTRRVSDCVSIMIFILSLVGFEAANLPSMLIGAMIVFIPQFALAIIRPSRACGGADLKISTAIAFMLGEGKGVFALIVGMLLAVIVMAIYNKVNAPNQKEAFPLVPFLSIGAMLAYII
jgi:prepilin signal peptidase PulO-like enzyme (type II secretory pathway)